MKIAPRCLLPNPHTATTIGTDGGYYVVDTRTSRIYRFDGLAALIWLTVCEGITLSLLVSDVADAEGAPDADRVAQIVTAFIDHLDDVDLLDRASLECSPAPG